MRGPRLSYSEGMSVETKPETKPAIKPRLTPQEHAAVVARAEAIRKKALAEGRIEFWDIDRVNAELGRDRPE